MVKRARSTGPAVADLCAAMERIAPTWAAAEWDNVGLLAGGMDWPAARLLLTIDLTAAVLEEARQTRCHAIVSYHPPIFQATKRWMVDDHNQEGIAAAALASGIALYSPHTALDAAPDGVNEVLARIAGLDQATPFAPIAPLARCCKLVVFVPPTHLDAVAEALFDVGAGQIGEYQKCSFRLSGQGTFLGGEASAPVIGRRGRLERVAEVRLEVIVAEAWLDDAVRALRAAHPYEEPAFDVYPLAPVSDPRFGQGRMSRFAAPTRVVDVAKRLKRRLKLSAIGIVGDARQRVGRTLVCAGAAGSLPFELPDPPCGKGDLVITGEVRHHDARRYERSGAAAIVLGHWESERPVLVSLAARLKKLLPAASLRISRADRGPFQRTKGLL